MGEIASPIIVENRAEKKQDCRMGDENTPTLQGINSNPKFQRQKERHFKKLIQCKTVSEMSPGKNLLTLTDPCHTLKSLLLRNCLPKRTSLKKYLLSRPQLGAPVTVINGSIM